MIVERKLTTYWGQRFAENTMIMTAKEFFKQFPDEAACIRHMRKEREKNGLVCRKCGSQRLSWLSTIDRWECMDCRAKTTIRSGTIMMHSKLPLQTWYYCMFLMMTTTTKAVSAKDMQQRLGMKRYEPVWYMMQKIRLAMGKADESFKLDGTVEFDDGFFRAEKKEKDPHQHLFNRGRGSERTQPVLVAVQRVTRSKRKTRDDIEHNTRAGRMGMKHLPDFTGKTYGALAKRLLTKKTTVISDANPSYNAIKPHVESHQPSKTEPKKAAKALPWVHIAISNAKRVFLGIYHSISDCWLQCYLNEFCFKFNRRYERHVSVNQLITVIATNKLQ